MSTHTNGSASRAQSFPTPDPGLSSFDQYLADITNASSDPLPRDEEVEVARRVQAGDEKARKRLVTANLRFVVSYVKRYKGRGLPFEDLVALGNEGLLKAADKFDPDAGIKYISYAVWWVRQVVLEALAEQTRPVRIPANQNSNLAKLSRSETALTQKLGRPPTDQEIAKELGVSVQVVRALRRIDRAEVRLDAPRRGVDAEDGEPRTLHETLKGTDGPEAGVETRLLRERIDSLMGAHLAERERRIVVLYHGLDNGGEGLTLEEIGKILGLTRERVRQLRNRAIEKLREAAPALAS